MHNRAKEKRLDPNRTGDHGQGRIWLILRRYKWDRLQVSGIRAERVRGGNGISTLFLLGCIHKCNCQRLP